MADSASQPLFGTAAPSDWRAAAACRDGAVSSEVMFPPRGAASPLVVQAKAVCGSCPVQSDCLDYALSTNQRFGVWGGLSERERRPLRRALRTANSRPIPQRGAGRS